MNISVKAQARLQAYIEVWLKTEVPEAAHFFEEHKDKAYTGVAVSNDTVVTGDCLAYHATKAACLSITQTLETLGINKD